MWYAVLRTTKALELVSYQLTYSIHESEDLVTRGYSYVVPDPAVTRLNASSRTLSRSSSRGGSLLFSSS